MWNMMNVMYRTNLVSCQSSVSLTEFIFHRAAPDVGENALSGPICVAFKKKQKI